MAVTRYQFRLSVYLATVVVAALVAASPRLVAWGSQDAPRLRLRRDWRQAGAIRRPSLADSSPQSEKPTEPAYLRSLDR
jgi:hypothetical protein